MKIIKNIFKSLSVIFFIIIPVGLILYSMFIDFLGCYLIFNNDNSKLELLLANSNLDSESIKIVFLDTTASEGTNIILINKKLIKKSVWVNDKWDLVEYVKTNGIDLYNTVTIINYIYIIIVAVIILFKKFLENADMFGKFEERDN